MASTMRYDRKKPTALLRRNLRRDRENKREESKVNGNTWEREHFGHERQLGVKANWQTEMLTK